MRNLWNLVFLSDENCCYAIMFLGFDSHPNLIKKKAIFNLYMHIFIFIFILVSDYLKEKLGER